MSDEKAQAQAPESQKQAGDALEEQLAAAGRSTQTFQLPALQSLDPKASILSKLDPEQRKLAEQIAKQTDFTDPMKIIGFGERQMMNAQGIARSLASKTQVAEMGKIGELSAQLKQRMRELGIGDLREGALTKMLKAIPILGSRVSAVQRFMDRYQSLAGQIDQILQAMGKDGLEIQELHAQFEQLVTSTGQTVDNLEVAIAGAELALTGLEEKARAMAEKFKGTTDAEEIEQMQRMLEALTSLDLRIVDLKASRLEAMTSRITMRNLQRGMRAVIGLVKSSQTLMQQAWFHQAAIAMAEAKLRGTSEMVKNAREFTREMMRENAARTGQTLGEIDKLQGEGFIDVETIEKVANQVIELQEQIDERLVQARKSLADQKVAYDRIGETVKKAGTNATTLLQALETDFSKRSASVGSSGA